MGFNQLFSDQHGGALHREGFNDVSVRVRYEELEDELPQREKGRMIAVQLVYSLHSDDLRLYNDLVHLHA